MRPLAYQETSAKVVRRGTWTAVSGAAYYGAKARYAKVSGASATFTFTGRSVAWVGVRCPSCGKAKVYVNGAYLTTINLNASVSGYRRNVWARTWTTSATRTVKVVCLGTARHPRVYLDAFLVLR